MDDCDSNGQRSFTKYEELCCSHSNKGDIIPIPKDDGCTGYEVCPDSIPKWCLGVHNFTSCYEILQSNQTPPSGYYNIILSNGNHVLWYGG